MDIIITGLLFVIAFCIVFGKAIKIEIHHTHSSNSNQNGSDLPKQEQVDEIQPNNLNNVIKAINEVMEVFDDERTERR